MLNCIWKKKVTSLWSQHYTNASQNLRILGPNSELRSDSEVTAHNQVDQILKSRHCSAKLIFPHFCYSCCSMQLFNSELQQINQFSIKDSQEDRSVHRYKIKTQPISKHPAWYLARNAETLKTNLLKQKVKLNTLSVPINIHSVR